MEIIDNFLTPEQHKFVLNYCEDAAYHYGEVDRKGLPPTGMVHLIDSKKDIYELFRYKTQSYCLGQRLCEMYINCFAPSERPYFHTDGEDGITFLYYPNDKWEPDDGGETQFVINNEIRGIFPTPNRLVLFEGNILHRATTFRDRHRFTVAIKYTTSS